MLKFNSIGQIEKERIPFIDAVTEADTYNGAFGDVEEGVFKVGADKTKAIMQIECGDDEGMPKYFIPKGTHVRVIDLESKWLSVRCLSGSKENYWKSRWRSCAYF